MQWEGRHREDWSVPFSDWGTVEFTHPKKPNSEDPDYEKAILADGTPGYYQFRARNGSGQNTWAQSMVVKVVKVDVEPLPHPPLEPGRICANAQADFRKAPWKAIVKPVGTTATVSVSGVAIVSEELIEVSDGHIFYVHSESEYRPGGYAVSIVHDDCSDCLVTNHDPGNMVFVFVYVVNTNSIPTTRSSASGTYTDTSAGGSHRGGHAIVEWTRSEHDHFPPQLGDTLLDLNVGITGVAKNYDTTVSPHTDGENNVEFYAAMSDMGKIQVGTYPAYIDVENLIAVYTGGVMYDAGISYSAEAQTNGYKSQTGSLAIGGTLFDIIGFGLGVEIPLSGKFACAGGIGLSFNNVVSQDIYAYSWHGVWPDPTLQSGNRPLEINFQAHYESPSVPFDIPFGFSGGVSMKETEINPLLLGRSEIHSPLFSITNEEYTIY